MPYGLVLTYLFVSSQRLNAKFFNPKTWYQFSSFPKREYLVWKRVHWDALPCCIFQQIDSFSLKKCCERRKLAWIVTLMEKIPGIRRLYSFGQKIEGPCIISCAVTLTFPSLLDWSGYACRDFIHARTKCKDSHKKRDYTWTLRRLGKYRCYVMGRNGSQQNIASNER